MAYPLTIKQAITDTKIKFSLWVLVLAAIIVIGSFYLIGYLNSAITKQILFASSLQYRAEYIAQTRGVGLLAATQEALFPTASVFVGGGGEAQGIPVLTYHSILSNKNDYAVATTSTFEGGNVSLANFKQQMFALKRAGWQTVSYEDLEAFLRGEKKLPEKSFVITFDDGAKNSFYPVDPILAALDYTAVAFILPGHSLGMRSTYYLNRDDLEIMHETGRWTIESHGQDIHVSLPTDGTGELKDNALSNRMWIPLLGRLETHEEYQARIEHDLHISKQNLEEALGISVTGFAFPFGDYGQNASNDSRGQETILTAARKNYSLAFYQNWNKGNFTFNYPNPNTFLVKRIPVGADWGAEKLMAVLNAASPKPIPYFETISSTSGWENDWGSSTIENGMLHLRAATSTTGALSVLDGTYPWANYMVEMDASWEKGFVMILFNMQSEKIGRACVFSRDGTVQLQSRTADDILILRETKVKTLKEGDHRLGAVSTGTTTACVVDGTYVIDATLPPASGGIGVEAWAPELGEARAFIKNVSVTERK